MKILVVDDNPDIATLVSTVLTDAGHDVSSVGTGSAALSASIMHEYDLLICDLMLPDLQGTEIVRALKAQSPRLPVLVISALNPDDWAKPCEDAGATRFMQKPLSLKEIRQEVELVEKARLKITIALVDTDPIHSTRLGKILEALGCDVASFRSGPEAQTRIEAGRAVGLLVVDADAEGGPELIRWGKARDIPAFAFCGTVKAGAEDELMRAGAAFLLSKPIDIDNLLTQAAFLVAM